MAFVKSFREFGTIMLQSFGAGVTVNIDKPIFINLSSGKTVQSIYNLLKDYNDVRVESLEGTLISRTTDFSELQGAAFYIRIGHLSFKVVQDSLSSPTLMHKFLFESEDSGLSKYIFMHKYLTRISKSFSPGTKYSKEHISSIIDQVCPINSGSELSKQEIYDKLNQTFKELQEMSPVYEEIHQKSVNFARGVLWSGFGVTVLQFLYITSGSYYYYCWDVMEAQAYLITLANTLFGLSGYVYFRLNPHQLSFYSKVYEFRMKRYANSLNFNLDLYNQLKEDLKSTQALITLDSNLNPK